MRDVVSSDVRQYIRPSPEKLEQFKKDLVDSEDAMNYLKIERGLAEETIKYFQLGYDKDRDAIVIPIFKNKELINLRYRLINPKERQPKYLQEKDCEVWLYHEEGINSGLSKHAVLVVEGEFDCMSVWQSGIKNVVSPASGKDSYGVWLELLDPIPEVYIAYDNDKAGKEASYKFAERVGVEKCKEVTYSEDVKDANEFFQKYTAEDFRKRIKDARPFYTRKYNDLLDVISLIRDDHQDKLELDILPDVKLTPDHLTAISGATNAGKCHGKDTEILMYDGSIKMVQDIVVGDKLMGEDSKPKTVLSLASGEEEMFRVWVQGEYYDVNKSHILSLKKFNKHYYEKTVEEYLKIPEKTRSTYRGWKVPIHFEEKKIDIDPYYLGLWLGDGSSNDTSVTTMDNEIVEYLKQYSNNTSLKISITEQDSKSKIYRIYSPSRKFGSNSILSSLQKLNLINNKHIPFDYKTNSEINRLKLLAGLIDSDGYLSSSSRSECYEIIQKNKQLADDIVYIARSLGFRAIIKKCNKSIKSTGFIGEYYRIHIVGDLGRIPVVLDRKKSTFIPKKNWMTHLIKIEPLGIGKYYGFTLDGNGLYVLGNFAVTHNTMYALNIAKRLVDKGIPTLVLPVERGVQYVGYRFLQVFSEKTDAEFKAMNQEDWEKIVRKVAKTPIYFSMPKADELSELVSKAKRILGIKAVVLDHLDYLVRNNSEKEETAIRNTMHEIKSLAVEHGVMMFVVTHTRRVHQAGSEMKKKPTMFDIRGSTAIEQDSETVVILDKFSDCEMEVDIQKNKGKMTSKIYTVDYDTGLMGSVTEKATSIDDF